jgi:hypothetical protein
MQASAARVPGPERRIIKYAAIESGVRSNTSKIDGEDEVAAREGGSLCSTYCVLKGCRLPDARLTEKSEAWDIGDLLDRPQIGVGRKPAVAVRTSNESAVGEAYGPFARAPKALPWIPRHRARRLDPISRVGGDARAVEAEAVLLARTLRWVPRRARQVAGLTSRWAMLRSWRAASPRAICRPTSQARATGSGPPADSSSSRSDCPSSNSIATQCTIRPAITASPESTYRTSCSCSI